MVSEKEEEGKCAEEMLGQEGDKEWVEVTEEVGDHGSEGNAKEEGQSGWVVVCGEGEGEGGREGGR